MDVELEVRSVAELERLQSLAAACGEGAITDSEDVQEALEEGFAWVIWLEAVLSRSNPDTGAAVRLRGLIGPMRDELEHLLMLHRPEPGTWRTLGFVLPAAT